MHHWIPFLCMLMAHFIFSSNTEFQSKNINLQIRFQLQRLWHVKCIILIWFLMICFDWFPPAPGLSTAFHRSIGRQRRHWGWRWSPCHQSWGCPWCQFPHSPPSASHWEGQTWSSLLGYRWSCPAIWDTLLLLLFYVDNVNVSVIDSVIVINIVIVIVIVIVIWSSLLRNRQCCPARWDIIYLNNLNTSAHSWFDKLNLEQDFCSCLSKRKSICITSAFSFLLFSVSNLNLIPWIGSHWKDLNFHRTRNAQQIDKDRDKDLHEQQIEHKFKQFSQLLQSFYWQTLRAIRRLL